MVIKIKNPFKTMLVQREWYDILPEKVRKTVEAWEITNLEIKKQILEVMERYAKDPDREKTQTHHIIKLLRQWYIPSRFAIELARKTKPRR